ncbi:MAG TPA: DNA mismatch repair endonuclease MutL [Virgibacillus sp.]|nr:DNA mismatch repair endonuclease MutL [Virgibacillus sp.]
MKIRQLPDALANKIAAGEVIERPASVVKELIENSIDAKSTWIKVELKEAGLEQIKITDNGTGMSERDCERAFSRHATSKIKYDADLFHIKTLGFRGEALASIAAVSKLTIKTSEGKGAGTLLALEGGKVISRTKSDARQGTEITVNELFYNTPARLKYMKTLHTELGHITDLLNRLAFAHPNIRFHAVHNGKKLFRTSGTGDLLQVISQVYGMNVAKKMIPISKQTLDFDINGFISKPELTRASRSYISTIINGRYIRSTPLTQAIMRAYHTLLPIHRAPIVVLSITMDPILVDVNVHPTKLEVRFSKEKELIAAIEESIRSQFRRASLIPSIDTHTKQEKPSIQQTLHFQQPSRSVADHVYQEKRTLTHEQSPKENNLQVQQPTHEHMYTVNDNPPNEDNEQDEGEQSNDSSTRIPTIYPIGQLHGTYILAQNEEGLYMIDQHAAQERIKYEYYKKKLATPKHESQSLLIPLTFEFSNRETLFIEQFKTDLEEVGLNFEPFGNQTYVVRSHPIWFPKGIEEEIIREMIEQIIREEKVNIEDLRDEAAMLMACKRSIKANEYLNIDDMSHLIKQLHETADPFTCPHGRPIIIHFSSYDLEKMFKRVM